MNPEVDIALGAADAPAGTPAAAPADAPPDVLSPAQREQALQRLLAAVGADPSAFDFFALLRQVDALRRQHPRTGESLRPRQDALRLGQAAELDFAPAALHRLEWREQGAPRLSVRFFGLLGPQGPMPLHFTEVVRDRTMHRGDTTLAHFLDLFHHRLLSLFYRAWAQAQPVVHLDRPADDRFQAWVASCAGIPPAADASAGERDHGPLPRALSAQALTFNAGWLTERTRHPERLTKVLRQQFGIPAQVREHVGHWLDIDRSERTRLGFARSRAERSLLPPPALGRNVNAGNRVWDRQTRFRLHLGPLTRTQYEAFLPGGATFAQLQQWVRLLAGRELSWDLQLSLQPDQRPPPRLGRGARLGLSFWLGRAKPAATSPSAPRELRLRPHSSFLLHRSEPRGAPHA